MTNQTSTVSFLENLRFKTNDSHKKLERLPVSASILSEQLSADAYAHYLQLMYGVIAATENNIFPILSAIIPDLEQRRKLALLQNDIEMIGNSNAIAANVFNIDDPSVPFALGVMYTVEGSSLGGRFILRNIQTVLGYDENNGAQYFAGYGNQTGSYWKNFLNILVQYEQETHSGETIVAGAQYAFDAIHNHFEQNPQR